MTGDPVFDIAADLDTPVSAYLKLAPFGTRFLLESVEGGERIGRYSFIGFGDGLEVRLDGDGLVVGGDRSPMPATREELLTALRGALERAPRPEPEHARVPFRGGLVGATGFSMHHWLEGLAGSRPAPEPPLARYFAPASILVFDHMSRRAALLHAGSEAERRSLRAEVIAALRGGFPERPRSRGHAPLVGSLSEGEYQEGVRSVQDHIRAGDAFQVVLSIRFAAESEMDPFEVYRAIRLLNPSPYMFFQELPGLAVVGGSPEALVRLEGREGSLRPIAGTRPRGADEAEDRALGEDLLGDAKENAEHVMLVDLARNDLGRVALPGTIRVDPFRALERYSHVIHMVSGVRGVIRPDADSFDAFAASFPAGTVVGAPKVRAAEIVRALEPVPRRYYAGAVGYFGVHGSMDQAITIRTVVFEDGECSVQAGAGIVADSVPATEYQEVLHKSRALREALRMATEGL